MLIFYFYCLLMPRGRRNDFHLKGTEVLQNRAVIWSGALKDKQASNMHQCGKCSRKDRNKVMQELKETVACLGELDLVIIWLQWRDEKLDRLRISRTIMRVLGQGSQFYFLGKGVFWRFYRNGVSGITRVSFKRNLMQGAWKGEILDAVGLRIL